MAATLTKTQKASGGAVHFLTHASTATKTSMAFTMYIPPQALAEEGGASACPVLYYLSGLTCTNMNFIEKACAVAAVRIFCFVVARLSLSLSLSLSHSFSFLSFVLLAGRSARRRARLP
jgi:hypothetical protein